jgi:hypothetical protein
MDLAQRLDHKGVVVIRKTLGQGRPVHPESQGDDAELKGVVSGFRWFFYVHRKFMASYDCMNIPQKKTASAFRPKLFGASFIWILFDEPKIRYRLRS